MHDLTAHDPGGKVKTPIPGDMTAGAIFGGDRNQYRYTLHRTWGDGLPSSTVMFLLMNPSTADHLHNDSTVKRCISFAKQWGGTKIFVGNVAAYRSTDQSALMAVDDPFGPDNDMWIREMAMRSVMVLVGFGMPKDKRLLIKGHEVIKSLKTYNKNVRVFGWTNPDRETGLAGPKHPLYIPADTETFLI